MTDAATMFRALGDPVRCRIVELLAAGDRSVGELAAEFPITLQAVARHINVLEDAGVVTKTKHAQTRTVHLEPAALDATGRWIVDRRRRIDERYERLDEVLALINALGPHSPSAPTSDPTTNPATTEKRDDR